ncbi:MAG: sugar phosphate nucleotidyltransferase [Acidobacteriota bacterium]|jgi:NDP-sugar pyrophosphorylase family protein
MVLAAGRGVRMLPLTEVLPKPALPLPDGPVIASALRLAAAAGAERIVINLCHLAEEMAAVVADVSVPGVKIELSFEHQLMGTAGGLAKARDRGLLGDEGSILVINGDGVFGLDLRDLFDRHFGREDLVTLALLPHLDPARWSRISLGADGAVEAILPPGIADPNQASFLYPGVMAVRLEAIEALPLDPAEVPATLWKSANSARRFGGVVVAGHWREVGTPGDYREAVCAHLSGSTVVHPSAVVSPRARITNSLIGRGVSVMDNATVEDSVVAEGAVVRQGGLVRASVLLGATTVATGEAVVRDVRALTPVR